MYYSTREFVDILYIRLDFKVPSIVGIFISFKAIDPVAGFVYNPSVWQAEIRK